MQLVTLLVQDLSCQAFIFTQNSEQKMFCADVTMIQTDGLLGGVAENAFALVGQGEVNRRRHPFPDCEAFLDFAADVLNRSVKLETTQKTLVFSKQTQQQMLCLYSHASELTGLVSREKDYSPRSFRVPFKHLVSRGQCTTATTYRSIRQPRGPFG